MDLISFVAEGFIIVIPVLVVLGTFIKNTNLIIDELIPVILTVFGILLCSGVAQTLDVNTIIQGVLCAGAAVLGNQTIKQLGKTQG